MTVGEVEDKANAGNVAGDAERKREMLGRPCR